VLGKYRPYTGDDTWKISTRDNDDALNTTGDWLPQSICSCHCRDNVADDVVEIMNDAWNSVVVLITPFGGANWAYSYELHVDPIKYCKFTLHDPPDEVTNDEWRSTWSLYTPSDANVKVLLPTNEMPALNCATDPHNKLCAWAA
jgi:hypothetical protein